jgi:GNAT superfamily N-acetyltransferase
MTVRSGTGEDVVQCVVMASRFWELTDHKNIPFDPDSTIDYFELGLKSGLFSVAEVSGNLVGFVIGVTAPCMVNRNYKIGAELAWWVEPEHRNGSIGIKLLKHIEQGAKEAGCAIWSMMCLESQEPEKVESMYLRMGYTKTERSYARSF